MNEQAGAKIGVELWLILGGVLGVIIILIGVIYNGFRERLKAIEDKLNDQLPLRHIVHPKIEQIAEDTKYMRERFESQCLESKIQRAVKDTYTPSPNLGK